MAWKTLEEILSNEEKQQIIADYKNNISLRELEKKYHHTRTNLSKWLTKIGIKTTIGNHHRTYFHNEDFFETIDTEEKAYWLGFMFADGYIVNNENRYGEDQFGISLAEDSLDAIIKFKKSIQATNPINYDNSDKQYNKQRLCKLVLCSQKTVNDLIDKGCVKQKTLILEPPKHIPENLIHHFLRGFFDGDGSLIRATRSDSTHISFEVSFTTTKSMAQWIKEILQVGSVTKELRREYTWYWRLTGNQQIIQFYHYLYDDATIWLDRKYNKFQELIEKYS